ncbi:phosphatidylinositol 3,4,5-trisphosphate 3-phosphatase and protein-tyrosine-phosphatase PTEN1-like [Bidens hawaiensis]|uniref:phosphatidylinositol 3,4,5-trisphosphate 3-phosphatase and protein-tyrosine-phosphatase PTEN1-like n=1 Tax=Bidens hawaiensis TaxID=980011 RepID=UPI004049AEAD
MGANASTLNNDAILMNYVSKSIFIRRLVSQKRRRLLVGGYDLDMSYITPRILAMSFPAERMMAIYRNPMWQVKEVLEMRHRGHYKVYNLCIEEEYDPSHFNGFLERYPFDDNHVPPLALIKGLCESVNSWLSSDPKNIVVIHCMAGKGRTGLMVCSYLVYTGMLAEEALQVYADKRTTNNLGVTIPSQRRYVNYWQKCLSFPKGCPPNVSLPEPCTRVLQRIRIYDAKSVLAIFFVLSEMQEVPGQLYRPSIHKCKNYCSKKTNTAGSDSFLYPFIKEDDKSEQEKSDEMYCLECYFDKALLVTGDVRVTFYEKNIGGRFCYACFNTAFIENNMLQLSILELDKVGTKARSIAGPEFRVELQFGPVDPNHQPDPDFSHCQSFSATSDGNELSDGGD